MNKETRYLDGSKFYEDLNKALDEGTGRFAKLKCNQIHEMLEFVLNYDYYQDGEDYYRGVDLAADWMGLSTKEFFPTHIKNRMYKLKESYGKRNKNQLQIVDKPNTVEVKMGNKIIHNFATKEKAKKWIKTKTGQRFIKKIRERA